MLLIPEGTFFFPLAVARGEAWIWIHMFGEDFLAHNVTMIFDLFPVMLPTLHTGFGIEVDKLTN